MRKGSHLKATVKKFPSSGAKIGYSNSLEDKLARVIA